MNTSPYAAIAARLAVLIPFGVAAFVILLGLTIYPMVFK